MSILYGLLIVLFIFICLLLVFITLAQPHYEEGFGGLFGGSGPESFFGVKGNITAIKITAVLGLIFFILTLIMNRIPSPIYSVTEHTASSTQQNTQPKAPAEKAAFPLSPPSSKSSEAGKGFKATNSSPASPASGSRPQGNGSNNPSPNPPTHNTK